MYVQIDIDDTIANTIDIWIKRYNRKYKDNLKVESIKDWNLAQYSKCGNKIYDLLNSKTLYKYIKPLPYALEGINLLRNMGFEIIYVTGGLPSWSVYKHQWLIDNNFWNDKDHYVQTSSKFLIQSQLLIDDNVDNIKKFKGYLALLISKAWNENYEYNFRINNWKEIIDTINKYKDSLI